MEAHRNTWLTLVVVLSAIGAVFLGWALTGKGDFWDQPRTPYALAFFAVAALCFVLAVRQARVPFLRGSEAALLHRKLLKLHAEIDALGDPTVADAEKLVADAKKWYGKYAPQRMREVQGAVDRASDQGPRVTVEYLRQGIATTMSDLEKGGSV
jgi:hypothetical protein